jgi:site-specific recombinase XerD
MGIERYVNLRCLTSYLWRVEEEGSVEQEIMKKLDPNAPNTPPPTDLVFINSKNKSIGRNDFWRTINRIGKRCGVHAAFGVVFKSCS